jgi:hypothetical protein
LDTVVRQIDSRLDDQTTEQGALDQFKATLRDDVAIQELELN